MDAKGRRFKLVPVLVVLVAIALLGRNPVQASPAPSGVVSRPVQFTVRAVNRSLVPCASDGASAVIAGHLIGPAGAPANPSAVTLYLHGLGFGAFFWDFQNVSGHDYANSLALAGEVSVVIDRLGYGNSSRPNGSSTCIGAEADIAHQIIGELRSGSYQVTGGPAVAFARVGLVGHSVGSEIAQIEAYSFRDIDGLGVLSFADPAPSLRAVSEFVKTGAVCTQGGQGGYAPFGQTGADFAQVMFHDADPAVVSATVAARSSDPCGDTSSVPFGIAVDLAQVPTIRVPVLLLYGSDDALFPPPAGQLQRLLYLFDRDVTLVSIADTGHAVTLERSAPQLQSTMATWLRARGL